MALNSRVVFRPGGNGDDTISSYRPYGEYKTRPYDKEDVQKAVPEDGNNTRHANYISATRSNFATLPVSRPYANLEQQVFPAPDAGNQKLNRSRHLETSGNGRISGYAGHIPGLQHSTSVSTSEFARWKLDNERLNPTTTALPPIDGAPTIDGGFVPMYRPPQSSRDSQEYRDLPAHLTAYEIATGPQTNNLPANQAERGRISGYSGYVPGLHKTHGINSATYARRWWDAYSAETGA